jgi:hypothetical protein
MLIKSLVDLLLLADEYLLKSFVGPRSVRTAQHLDRLNSLTFSVDAPDCSVPSIANINCRKSLPLRQVLSSQDWSQRVLSPAQAGLQHFQTAVQAHRRSQSSNA